MLRIAAVVCLAALLAATTPAAAGTLPEMPEPDWETACSGAGTVPGARDAIHDGAGAASGGVGDGISLVGNPRTTLSDAAGGIEAAVEGLVTPIPGPSSSIYAGLRAAFQAVWGGGGASDPLSTSDVLVLGAALAWADAAFVYAHAVCTA